MSKRKLPRRELPWIGPLLESLPFSKLPTNHTVLQRLYFEVERNHGSSGLDVAAVKVKNELIDLWTYAGYGDILHHPTFFIKKLKSLTLPYKSLFKTPVSRRSTPSFLKKESDFLKSLTKLFNITVQDLIFSGKITNEDRDFLLHHWTKRISYAEQTAALSSTPLSTAAPTSTPPNPSASPTASSPSSPTTGTHPSSDAEYKPKRPCVTPKPAATPIHLPKDILRRVGPTADRLGLSNNQLTTITAVIANHAGGELSLSKSTARRHRASGRRDGAQEVRDNFSLTLGQVNFDGKLLSDLNGLQKVNRLAVLVVKETENQILGIAKTANATGEYFFYISFYISPISLRLKMSQEAVPSHPHCAPAPHLVPL